MSRNKILKNYVSEIDQFLIQFDRSHSEFSSSQKAEKLKYSRIDYLRDIKDRPEEKNVSEGL